MNKIDEAKQLLEQNGYLVAGPFKHEWQQDAIRLNNSWVAFRIRGQKVTWIRPREFSEGIGINRRTLTRLLKEKGCPNVEQERGPKGRLLFLQPTPELITFLRRNKGSS